MNFTDPKIEKYATQMSQQETPVRKSLSSFTRENYSMWKMLIGPLEASLLQVLIGASRAEKVLEIGTFTGYSALAMAEALPENGEVHTLDINPQSTKTAQKFWDQSPHGAKITAHLGPARDVLPTIDINWDFVFIDADKKHYKDYLEMLLPKLNPHAMVVLDNALWSGRILDPDDNEASTVGIREVNEYVAAQEDWLMSLVPIRDGMFIIKPSPK